MTVRVLIVEDEPTLRRTLERALRDLHYNVVSVSDPRLAYEALDASDYDVVLLDIKLPHMSGDTLAIALLRQWPRLAGRLLFMSGNPWLRDDWPEELRGCPLLVKPFTLETLESAVQQAITTAMPRLQHKRNGG